jgi:hypothetical protein
MAGIWRATSCYKLIGTEIGTQDLQKASKKAKKSSSGEMDVMLKSRWPPCLKSLLIAPWVNARAFQQD